MLYTYFVCAKEFGWKPEEVDGIEMGLLHDLIYMGQQIKRKENEK